MPARFANAAFAVCLFLLILGTKWATFDRYGSPMPDWDQWDAEGPLYRAWLAGSLDWRFLLAAHNDYYPLKVMMEHAIGEGMVLDIFRDVLLQTLPDSDPRIPGIKKKLRVVCKEEEEHVAWGERETRRLLAERPGLALPFYGLIELQLAMGRPQPLIRVAELIQPGAALAAQPAAQQPVGDHLLNHGSHRREAVACHRAGTR